MSEHEMRERLTRLEAVVGENADLGIRREIGELRDSVRMIFDRLRSFELRFYAIIGGGAVVVWMLEKVWK